MHNTIKILSSFNVIKTTDDHIKLLVEVILFLLYFASMWYDFDSWASSHDELCDYLCFFPIDIFQSE
jgi:hypothetical protein